MDTKDYTDIDSAEQDSRKVPLSDEPKNGTQQLNKSTGEVEVYYNGMWCAR
jgi:hypothetical protein